MKRTLIVAVAVVTLFGCSAFLDGKPVLTDGNVHDGIPATFACSSAEACADQMYLGAYERLIGCRSDSATNRAGLRLRGERGRAQQQSGDERNCTSSPDPLHGVPQSGRESRWAPRLRRGSGGWIVPHDTGREAYVKEWFRTLGTLFEVTFLGLV